MVPELYLAIYRLYQEGKIAQGREIQDTCCHISYKLRSGTGNMYAMIQEVLRLNGGPDIGGVRKPLTDLLPEDKPIAEECAQMVREALARYVG